MWFLATKAVEMYRENHKGEYPGLTAEDEDIDNNPEVAAKYTAEVDEILGNLEKMIKQAAPESNRTDAKKYAAELVRYSDSKVHTVSAFLGGVASQEIIKILIKQYTIFNHTFVYDGIHGRCQVFK